MNVVEQHGSREDTLPLEKLVANELISSLNLTDKLEPVLREKIIAGRYEAIKRGYGLSPYTELIEQNLLLEIVGLESPADILYEKIDFDIANDSYVLNNAIAGQLFEASFLMGSFLKKHQLDIFSTVNDAIKHLDAIYGVKKGE